MPPKRKTPSGKPSQTPAAQPACPHYRIIAEPIKVPDQIAFRCLDCGATLPHDFASPAH